MADMAFGRGDVTNAAVAVLVVVPAHEVQGPMPRGLQAVKTGVGMRRPLLAGAEHRFSSVKSGILPFRYRECETYPRRANLISPPSMAPCTTSLEFFVSFLLGSEAHRNTT